jgi:hypothetical protein
VVHVGRPAFPALRHATPPALQPAVRLGERLALAGEALEGDSVRARFTSVYALSPLELDAEPDGDEHGFVVQFPPAAVPPAVPLDSPLHPSSWRAGIHAVSAVVRRGDRIFVTNSVPAALAPTIVSAAAAPVPDGVQVTVTCVPPVWRGQRASLVVGQQELPADPFGADRSDTLTFTAPELPSGAQWIRLRVDGVESLLVDRGAQPPLFEPSERVTLP